MKKNMKIIVASIVTIIIFITIEIVIFINENKVKMQELTEEEIVEIFNSDFTLNDLSDRFNELYGEGSAAIENQILIISQGEEYEFILDSYQLIIITENNEVLEVLKNLILTIQSFYYDDTSVLVETVDMFLNNVICLQGVEIYEIDGNYEIYIDLAQQINVYEPDFVYSNEDKIYLMNSDEIYSYANDNFTLNNAYLYIGEDLNVLNFGGILNTTSSEAMFSVNVYNANDDLVSTTDYDIKDMWQQINFNIDLSKVSASYIIIN